MRLAAIKVYDAAAAVGQKCHQVLHESAGGNEDCATEVLNQPSTNCDGRN